MGEKPVEYDSIEAADGADARRTLLPLPLLSVIRLPSLLASHTPTSIPGIYSERESSEMMHI